MGKPSKYRIYHAIYQNEIEEYRSYMLLLGYNKVTAQSRYLLLKQFFSFLESSGIYQLTAITPVAINDFYSCLKGRKSLRNGNPLALKSVHDMMRGVQIYLGYALAQGKISSSPISHLKFSSVTEKPVRTILTQPQIKQLYAVTENLTERTLLHIAYGCGLRVSEISDLNKNDLHLEENLIVVRKGKFNKRRIVPISDKVKDELQEFLDQQEDKDNAVFYNSKATRMQEWTINKLFKQLMLRTDFGCTLTKAQLNKFGIHTLRHSIATHLLENGMKLEQVQTFLGHVHLQSTQTYTHISQIQLNELQQ